MMNPPPPAHDDPSFVAMPQLTLDEARRLTDEQLRGLFGGDLTALADLAVLAAQQTAERQAS